MVLHAAAVLDRLPRIVLAMHVDDGHRELRVVHRLAVADVAEVPRHGFRHAFVRELRRNLEKLRIARDEVFLATALHPYPNVRLRLLHQPRGGPRVLSVPLVVQRVACVVGVQREAAPQVAFHAIRRLVDDVVAHDGSPVVTGETETLDSDRVEARQQLARDAVPGVVPVGLLRTPVALEVEREHPELGREGRHLMLPARPALRDAMQKHDGIAVTHFSPVPSNARGGLESVDRHAHRCGSSMIREMKALRMPAPMPWTAETTDHRCQRLLSAVTARGAMRPPERSLRG